jgi:phosphoglycolate phosphatase
MNDDISRAIMVGDSHNDVYVAKNAGVPVIAVTFGYSQIPLDQLDPDALIDDFAEILSLVTKL